MKNLIGAGLLAKITKAEKEYCIEDSRTKGFFLRVHPSGRMVYYCQLARGKKIKIGDTTELKPTQARDIAKEHIASFKKGQDPIAEKKKEKAGNLKEFIAGKYGPWVESHRKTGKATVARIESCFPDLLKFQLSDLTAWQLEKWKTARLKAGIKPATVNRDMTALKAALSMAIEWGMLQVHPLTKVKPAKVDRSKKIRFLNPSEEKKLRQCLQDRAEVMRQERDSANAWREVRGYPHFPSLRSVPHTDHLAPMVLLSINTGIRRGEMFSLTWQDVNFQRAMLTIDGNNAKSGSTRHIPMNDEALTVLKEWREQTKGTGLVFPGKKGAPIDNIKRVWTGLAKSAGLSNFRWHDLRHHFASRLVMAGVDLNTVRELLGHADIKMTLRYAHLAPAHKAAAVAKLLNFTEDETDQDAGDEIATA